MKNIYQICENIPNAHGYIYVRATEREIEEREYRGGFTRFLSDLYAYGKKYPRGSKVENQPILSLNKFDKWLKEHKCV